MKKYLTVALTASALAPFCVADVDTDTLIPIQNEVHFRMRADGTFYQSQTGPTARANTTYYDCTGADYRLTGSLPRWHAGTRAISTRSPRRTPASQTR